MTQERWQSLMNDQSTELTEAEIKDGWHWCHEFDGLLVGPESSEAEFCNEWCGSYLKAKRE